MTMLADLMGAAPWQALKAAGYDGQFGYSGHNRGKCPPADYGSNLVAQGGLYLIVFEDSSNRALDGHSAGVADATFANNDADQQNYPLTAAIYWTADFPGTWAQVSEYARGWHETSRRPVGCYGDGDIIRGAKAAGFIRYGWRTCSGGFPGSRDLTGIDMVQVCAGEPGLVPVAGYSVDTNRTQPGVTDIGAWGATPTIAPGDEPLSAQEVADIKAHIDQKATEILTGVGLLLGQDAHADMSIGEKVDRMFRRNFEGGDLTWADQRAQKVIDALKADAPKP